VGYPEIAAALPRQQARRAGRGGPDEVEERGTKAV